MQVKGEKEKYKEKNMSRKSGKGIENEAEVLDSLKFSLHAGLAWNIQDRVLRESFASSVREKKTKNM